MSSNKHHDAQKEELDRQTSYATLLPHMEEGFGAGYRPKAGIVSDQNQKPREWLENISKYMQTQGEDVGYAIPDVLACEQQLRRLSRLPHEIAMRHQEMLDYRALLAILLLWDSWEQDASWPILTLEAPSTELSGFISSVRAALSPERAKEGLWVYTLARPHAELPDAHPLCLISRTLVLMPAADLGDLSELLPPCIAWYDRKRKRFLDPCAYLSERDLSRLLLQLRLLQTLNERADLNSPLYSPDAQLCGLLSHFVDDLLARRNLWRQKLLASDETAVQALRTRVLAVYGLHSQPTVANISKSFIRLDTATLVKNPLVAIFLPNGAPTADLVQDAGLTLYCLDGVPFARLSQTFLLEPSYEAGEDEALRRIKQEISLPDRFNPKWNQRMATVLFALFEEQRGRVGINDRVLSLLSTWADQYTRFPATSDRGVTLHYPMRDYPSSLPELLENMLGLSDESCIQTPFSDCLLVVENADQPPFEDNVLASSCLIEENGSTPARYALPPLSPSLCAWLQSQSELDDPYAPHLEKDSLCFKLDKAQAQIDVSFRILSRKRGAGTAITNAVTFVTSYPLRERPEAGAAFVLPAHTLPYVVVWPNVRLSSELWKQYFVYTHRPEAVDVWTLTTNSWVQGTLLHAVDEGARRYIHERSWQTASTERFPAYMVLKRGELTLGALVNDSPRRLIKHEPAAAIGIDFGSIATTVMIKQSGNVRPATFPRCLHRALLCTQSDDEHFLTDELLPKTTLLSSENGNDSTFYSVMDMFTDDPAHWQRVLGDGHIYYRENLSALLQKSENTLYYDMKWGEEDYILRVMRLFLKQVMLQASLCVRLAGSPSVSWRVSMPNALPLHKQEAYLELVRGLSREVSHELGMPLTTGCPPVLYATENQADGLYFLDRNEVSARSGYLNLDIGGVTTDISLWLNNATHATAECSLLLGCRQMLFHSLAVGHMMDFEQDFLSAPERAKRATQEILRSFKQNSSTMRGQQKCMFLLDDFFADYASDIRETMAQTRSQGRISYVESLLLFNIGFLFSICGELLERAFQDDDLRPLLPKRMELCIAGNGGQLLKSLSDEQREKLCHMALSRLSSAHPLSALLPIQSRHPKQEVAIGLLSDAGNLQSTLHGVDRWNGTDAGHDATGRVDLLRAYLPAFYRSFPQAAQRLMPTVFEDDGIHGSVKISPTAAMELETIFENERFKTLEDDVAMYVRCFAGVKQLWRV